MTPYRTAAILSDREPRSERSIPTWLFRFQWARRFARGRWERWWSGSKFGDIGCYEWKRVKEWSLLGQCRLWPRHFTFGDTTVAREDWL